MAEETQARQYETLEDDAPIGVSGGAGEGTSFDDYVQLPEEETFKAHVVDIKLGTKNFKGVDSERLYIWFELDEGEGKGQRYRDDMSPLLTNGKGARRSTFDELMKKLVGKYPAAGEYKKSQIVGLPIRLELTAPWGDKGLQFVALYKSPTADQKKVTVDQDNTNNTKTADVLPTDADVEQGLSEAELDEVFKKAGQ